MFGVPDTSRLALFEDPKVLVAGGTKTRDFKFLCHQSLHLRSAGTSGSGTYPVAGEGGVRGAISPGTPAL